MREIVLTRGYAAIVDDADFESASQFKWTAQPVKRKDGTISNVYAYRTVREGSKKHVIKLHRFLLAVSDPALEVDHKDGNGLNCQRHNLRTATHTQNMHNRNKQSNNTSGCNGVCLDKKTGRWRAYIKVNKKQITLGRFVNVLDAANAVALARIEHHPEYLR